MLPPSHPPFLNKMNESIRRAQGSLPLAASTGMTSKGVLAMAALPFYGSSAWWAVRASSGLYQVCTAQLSQTAATLLCMPATALYSLPFHNPRTPIPPEKYLRADEASSAAVTGADSVHQVWVRQALPAANATVAAKSSFVVEGNVAATMLTTAQPLVTATQQDGFAKPFTLTGPVPFYAFGVDVTSRMAFTSEAYLSLAYASGLDAVPNSGFNATYPGPALHFGAANRALKALTLNLPMTVGDLVSQTAVVQYDPIFTGSSGWFQNYEVAFARDKTNQFIEIRGGNVVEFRNLFGSWLLTDGADFSLGLPNVTAATSLVLQSNLTGHNWQLYNVSSLRRAYSPPPACVLARRCFAHVRRCALARMRTATLSHALRAAALLRPPSHSRRIAADD